jgi:hypothetical protein
MLKIDSYTPKTSYVVPSEAHRFLIQETIPEVILRTTPLRTYKTSTKSEIVKLATPVNRTPNLRVPYIPHDDAP